MIANSGWRHFIDHLWPAAIVSHKRAKVHRNVLKPRDVFESLHPGSIPAGLQPNAGNEFRKVVRGHAFAIVVCEHPVENRRGAVVADPLDTQANRNCKAGVDLSPIPIRSRPCQLVDMFSVLPVPFAEVEIQVEGVGLLVATLNSASTTEPLLPTLNGTSTCAGRERAFVVTI